jgi:hypothetical protein
MLVPCKNQSDTVVREIDTLFYESYETWISNILTPIFWCCALFQYKQRQLFSNTLMKMSHFMYFEDCIVQTMTHCKIQQKFLEPVT